MKVSVQYVIEHTYETRWRFQKDGERSRDRALAFAGDQYLDWWAGDITDAHVREQTARCEARLSRATVNRMLAALSCAFKTAYDDGLIDTCGPRFKRLPESGARERVPTRKEVADMLRALRRLGYASLVPPGAWGSIAHAVRLLYRTGMRRGEALGITARDLSRLNQICGSYAVELSETKGGTSRHVPVPDACTAMICGFLCKGWAEYGVEKLFPFSESAFSAAWRRARNEAGIGDWFVPHCLRHARATELVRAGTPIPVVAKLLGHSNWSTTQRYTHPNETDVAEAVNRR